jgi:signal transduction histidine kinase
LKTPLTPIKGWCYALTHPKILGGLNEKQKNAVITIDKNASRLHAIIDNLLDVQKLELHELKYNYVDTTTQKIMDRIKNNLEFIMEEKNINFVIEGDDIELRTDETRLIQVLTNLLQNSLDFTPTVGAKIEAGAKKDGNNVIFSVKDNGIGISKENQKNLFKKFYQIDTSLTRNHGGTGLGLTICKGIVEGLGGQIWVESDEGKGSIFYFSTLIKNSAYTSS